MGKKQGFIGKVVGFARNDMARTEANYRRFVREHRAGHPSQLKTLARAPGVMVRESARDAGIYAKKAGALAKKAISPVLPGPKKKAAAANPAPAIEPKPATVKKPATALPKPAPKKREIFQRGRTLGDRIANPKPITGNRGRTN